MFKNTLAAALAALTITGATFTASVPAQAGSGVAKAVVGGFIATVAGVMIGAAASNAAEAREREYRPARRPVPYGSGCGVRPVFDEDGVQVGVRRIRSC